MIQKTTAKKTLTVKLEDYQMEPIKRLLGYKPKVLFQFNRAYPGWECDSHGYVVMTKTGKKQVLLSTYGKFYCAKKGEVLEDIARYEELISNCEEALNTLKTGK